MNEQSIAAIYCRLSKEDLDKANKGDDSESIQNQKLILLDYAVTNGFLVHNVYVDEDLSGFSDRPSFKQMIKDAADGKFNTIICKHQSRFTRDMELIEKYIHGYFVEWGIRFISITDNVDTSVKGNKKARQIYGLINEWHSEDLSENIRTVFKKKMEAGQFLGPFACYGYTKCPKNRHNLAIDEEAAGIVREIFALYMEGNGVQSIAHILNQKNVPTPTQYKKNKGLNFTNPNAGSFSIKYGLWPPNTVRRILRNEVYIGTLIQGRERKASYKTKKVVIAPKHEWVIIKDNHPPIVAENVFYKVQQLIDRKRTGYAVCGGKIEKAKPHLLAGKLICAGCGSGMQRSGLSRNGKTHFLRCKLSAKSKRRECTPHCISQDKVESAIIEQISNLLRDCVCPDKEGDIIGSALSQISAQTSHRPKLEKQLLEFDTKINYIRSNIAKGYAEKLNGVISEDDFLSFKEVFEKEQQALAVNKKHVENELASIDVSQKIFGNIAALLDKYKRIDTLTHEIINDFVDNIQISERNPDTKEQLITIKWLF